MKAIVSGFLKRFRGTRGQKPAYQAGFLDPLGNPMHRRWMQEHLGFSNEWFETESRADERHIGITKLIEGGKNKQLIGMVSFSPPSSRTPAQIWWIQTSRDPAFKKAFGRKPSDELVSHLAKHIDERGFEARTGVSEEGERFFNRIGSVEKRPVEIPLNGVPGFAGESLKLTFFRIIPKKIKPKLKLDENL